MRGLHRLLQRSLQTRAVGEVLAAARGAGGAEAVACRLAPGSLLPRAVVQAAARGFAATAQQAWRSGAPRAIAASFTAQNVSGHSNLDQSSPARGQPARSSLPFPSTHHALPSAAAPSQLQAAGLRQFGFAAGAALRAGRAAGSAAGSRIPAAAAALRRPLGMAGSSLARQAGRRLKSTVSELKAASAAEASLPPALG